MIIDHKETITTCFNYVTNTHTLIPVHPENGYASSLLRKQCGSLCLQDFLLILLIYLFCFLREVFLHW